MASPHRNIKVLVAHGFGQSGPSFRYQTRTLERALRTSLCDDDFDSNCSVVFYYPDGPFQCGVSGYNGSTTNNGGQSWNADTSVNCRSWTMEVDNGAASDLTPGLLALANYIRAFGPFDGAIGFSQGGLFLAMVASLLEPTRTADELAPYTKLFHDGDSINKIQPPFQFLACFSSPDLTNRKFRHFWDPPVATPMLQVIGLWDTFIDEASSKGLASRFQDARLLFHGGGHFVPKDKKSVENVSNFVAGALNCLPVPILSGFRWLDDGEISASESETASESTTVTGRLPAKFLPVWRKPRGRQRGIVRVVRR